jgi:primosomal protein N' (replication factor Y)
LSEDSILRVAINVPLSRLFDYLPPLEGRCPAPGSRVLVPFGRRRVVGIVFETGTASELDPARLKRAEQVLDDEPLLSDADLKLVRFTSDYYHHPIGEAAFAAVPVLLRHGHALYPELELLTVTDAGGAVDIETLRKRASRQAELLECLLDSGGNGVEVESLTELMPTWRRVAKPLIEKGWATRTKIRTRDPLAGESLEAAAGPAPNDRQQHAIDTVAACDGFGAFVLDGVTGSGKTEVYMQLIDAVIRDGRQVLVLVPEIGLTPQLVSRFRKRLGIEPALMHSGLGNNERLAAWRQARSGAAQLVVGTRSAVFASMPNPGLIVVDEEHDHSFKQQEGLRYSARDLAVVRASHAGVPIVLGSATPSLELLLHCDDGSYTHLSLPERAGGARPPALRTVDVGRIQADDSLSPPLVSAIDSHLQAGGQVLLFLNRRGFAPTLICASCGHVAECRRCDSRLTVHARDNALRCHHCGASRPLDEVCEECGESVRPLGAGTERLEDAVQARFPDRTVTRIDSDSTQRKVAINSALEAAASGDADILVGTQMLSKGHHFPRLTLVGIVNADQGLFGTDFRSDERMAQSIVQVAGRAGREDRAGEVMIQTAFPDHPFWKRLIEGGYTAVARDTLAERKATGWPPYSRLALIRSAAHRRSDAHAFLDAARAMLPAEGLRVLGPVDAVMARKAGRYRAQLLIQSTDRRALHAALRELRPALESHPAGRKVRWSVDVDPIELF